MAVDAESVAMLISGHPQQVCVCTLVHKCVRVIMAELIDHQPVPICSVNTAQNQAEERNGNEESQRTK